MLSTCAEMVIPPTFPQSGQYREELPLVSGGKSAPPNPVSAVCEQQDLRHTCDRDHCGRP